LLQLSCEICFRIVFKNTGTQIVVILAYFSHNFSVIAYSGNCIKATYHYI